ncbi:MAG TPA: FAD-dependent oxidoreductase, partial [Nitriliruptoraceae bacterium]|nr:FAD-dependent oxidoreductase [Nitriliruptoraceae bacterium]
MTTTSEHEHAAHRADHHEHHQVDALVVGGGAAGLSAALMLARSRRTVVVVDAGEPRNAPAAGVHGFLSRDGMAPGELLAVGRDEVEHYGGEVRTGLVTSASRVDGRFEVHLDDGSMVSARRLVVTTGLVDELPDVEGLA